MIVAMKKATILFTTRDAESTIKDLRTLGVLHIEHQNPPEGRDISELVEKVTRINSSLDVLSRAPASGKTTRPKKTITGDWHAVADHIIGLNKREEQLESSSRTITGQINEWEHWGDIDPDQILHLSQKGIFFRLYQVPIKGTGNLP